MTAIDIRLDPPPTFDVLFVVDDSPAMAGYPTVAANLAALFGQLGLAVESFHIGVVTTDLAQDGLLHDRDDGLSYIASTGLPDGGCDANLTGDPLPVFAQIADVGTRGGPVRSPLEVMRRALDGRNPGFRRDHAALTVVFALAGDDESADDPSAYQMELGDATSVAAAFAQPSPRMQSFLRSWDATTGLDGDFASRISIEHGRWTLQGGQCVDAPSEICSFEYAEPDGGGTVIPACSSTDHRPCWRLVTDHQCDGRPGRLLEIAHSVSWPQRERDPRMPDGTHLIGQCLPE